MDFGTDNKSFSTSFFSASKRYWIGPIPVTLDVSVNGKVGIQYVAKAKQNGVSLTVKPFGDAYGTASAGVDILLAAAGVSASVTFLNASMPNTGALTLTSASPRTGTYSFDSDLAVSTLGHVDLWGKIGWSDRHYLNIFEWSGRTSTLPLKHESGIFP